MEELKLLQQNLKLLEEATSLLQEQEKLLQDTQHYLHERAQNVLHTMDVLEDYQNLIEYTGLILYEKDNVLKDFKTMLTAIVESTDLYMRSKQM